MNLEKGRWQHVSLLQNLCKLVRSLIGITDLPQQNSSDSCDRFGTSFSTRAESIYAGVCGYLNEQSLRCNAASMHMPPTALATVQADGHDSLLCSIKLAQPILISIQYLTTKSADEKEERPCIHKAERA